MREDAEIVAVETSCSQYTFVYNEAAEIISRLYYLERVKAADTCDTYRQLAHLYMLRLM